MSRSHIPPGLFLRSLAAEWNAQQQHFEGQITDVRSFDSCNVHTQARDVGVLVEGYGDCRYGIESLQGFDFFPQTGHVESVAVLARNDSSNQTATLLQE